GLREEWAQDVEEPARRANLPPPRLEVIHSPYRKFIDPLVEYIERLQREHPGRLVTAVVPEVVKRRWWQFLMHNYRAERLRSALLRRGDPKLVVVSVPWYLSDAPEQPKKLLSGAGEGNGQAAAREEADSEAGLT